MMMCIESRDFKLGIDRECTSKRRYSSEAEAEAEARIIFNEGGPNLSAYSCIWCNGAHLTSRSTSSAQ